MIYQKLKTCQQSYQVKKTELLNQLNKWVEKTNAPVPSVFLIIK